MPTAIEWTNETWNPTTGCTKVSPGCAHCYAEALTKRYAGRPGWPAEFLPWVPGNDTLALHPDRLDAPLSWKTPRRVFVDSMSDLFHEDVPFDYIDRVFAVMALTPQHTYQVLTKRPQRMREYMTAKTREDGLTTALYNSTLPMPPEVYVAAGRGRFYFGWPLPNVWLGVTVESQRWADERIPLLLDTPAAVRFISAEPLLGPIDIVRGYQWARGAMSDAALAGNYEPPLHWVIVGGESGPRHRPFDPAWARDLIAQCRRNNIAPFVKQLGGLRPGNKLEDLPEDLRVREFPEVHP